MADGPPRHTPAIGSALADGTASAPAEQILSILWKRRISLLITFLASMAVVAAITAVLPKVYEANALIQITPSKEVGSDFEAAQVSQVLAKTYAEVLQSPVVADRVIQDLPFEETREGLLNAVHVSPVSGSQLLDVSAEAATPQRARALANIYARVFIDPTQEFAQRSTAAKITLLAPAVDPDSAARPKPKLYLLVGAVLSAFLAVGVALLRERLSQAVQVDPTTTSLFDLPIVGRIPNSSALSLVFQRPSDPTLLLMEEPFRVLRTNLSFMSGDRRPFSLAVVSAEPGEGKTLCAANLGRAASEVEASTLFVDADLRLATASELFELEHREEGFGSFLAEHEPSKAFEASVTRVGRTELDVMPAGAPPQQNPSALLSSTTLAQFDSWAKERFDFVIYDTPAITAGADASLVASRCDAVLLVVDPKRSRRHHLLRAIEQLRRSGANIHGVALNRVSESMASYGYYSTQIRSARARPSGSGGVAPIERDDSARAGGRRGRAAARPDRRE
jgi:polysaccharide biosynthesis transport protein